MKKEKQADWLAFFFLAAVLGFEPRHTESESAVLPLHNTAIFSVPEYCITLKQGLSILFYKTFLKENFLLTTVI